jgi:hypothetical protein
MYTNYTFTATWTGVSNWKYDYTKTSSPLDESTNYFTVVAIDTAGNRKAIKRTLVVYRDGAVCVRTNGSATGDGTAWLPMNTLANAVSKIAALGFSKIKLAEGNYPLSTTLSIAGGTIIIGGYDQQFNKLAVDMNSKSIISSQGGSISVSSYCHLLDLRIEPYISFAITIAGPSSTISNCILTASVQAYQIASGMHNSLSFLNNLITGESSRIVYTSFGGTGSTLGIIMKNNVIDRDLGTQTCLIDLNRTYNHLPLILLVKAILYRTNIRLCG